jgi:hypothetical protein
MENIAATDSDSSQKRSTGTTEKLAKRLKRGSNPDREKAATEPVDSTQIDIEVELSLLQSVFDQALESGMKAKLHSQDNILRIEIHGARICPECKVWTTLSPCQTCGCK